VLSVVKGGAKGLQLLYTGTSSQSGIHLDLSVGIGAKMYDTVDTMLDDKSGLIANEVNNLKGQDDLAQQRADRLQASLDAEHDRLVQQFAAMETAVTSMNQLLSSLRQQTNAAFGNKNN
jgi:flagellar capping protein FliD